MRNQNKNSKNFSKPANEKGGDYSKKKPSKTFSKPAIEKSRDFSKPKSSKPYSKPTDENTTENAPSRKRTYTKTMADKSSAFNKTNASSSFSKPANDRNSVKNAKKPYKTDNYKGRQSVKSKFSQEIQKGESLKSSEVRLNRYIANSGLCSRRQADEIISAGRVSVNDEIITELGTLVPKGARVKVDGKKIDPQAYIYVLLNKPKGYITTKSDPSGRKTVMDLINMEGKAALKPVGRLDRNTTGVLLLTNDGDFAQAMSHPSFEIKKIYRATLNIKPTQEHMLAWVEGVQLDDGMMSFEQVGWVDEENDLVLGVEVHSGRNRVVRRMFEHFNYEVVSLDRVLFGEFDHLKLGRGRWRFLNEKEKSVVERIKRKYEKENAKKK